MKTKESKAKGKGKRAAKVKDLTVRKGERVKGGSSGGQGGKPKMGWDW